jgi:hypothetical protein
MLDKGIWAEVKVGGKKSKTLSRAKRPGSAGVRLRR